MCKVICESVCDHCLSSNNRLSVPISGGRGPRDLVSPRDWLARHCEKFTLEGALCWIFSLPIKCGMQHSRRPFEVCCVCMCMCECVCVFVCLRTLRFHFHTQRSFSKDETTSRAGKMGPETRSVIFPRCPACQFDSICVCRRDLTRKRRSYEHNSKLFLVMSKSHLIRRGITLSVNVCVCSLWVIKDFWLLVYCLSEVSFVWMWLVPAFFLFLACTGEDAAWFQRARLDRRLLSWAVSERKRCHRLLKRWVFQENLCTVQTQKKKKHKNTNISTRTQMWKGRWK